MAGLEIKKNRAVDCFRVINIADCPVLQGQKGQQPYYTIPKEQYVGYIHMESNTEVNMETESGSGGGGGNSGAGGIGGGGVLGPEGRGPGQRSLRATLPNGNVISTVPNCYHLQAKSGPDQKGSGPRYVPEAEKEKGTRAKAEEVPLTYAQRAAQDAT